VNIKVSEQIRSLQFGDLIEIYWLDASEGTGEIGKTRFDTLVRSVGFFLGLKGRRTKHVVIAKEIVDIEKACHYNSIPIGMIERIATHTRDALNPCEIKLLKKFVKFAFPRMKGKDGWVYVEGKNKKRLH